MVVTIVESDNYDEFWTKWKGESMVVKRTSWAFVAAAMFGMLMCVGTSARADDQTDTNAQLLKAIKSLQAEVASLRTEVTKVHKDQAKILRELASIKKGDAKSKKRKPKKADKTVYDIPVGNSPVLGPKDAKVTITEFVCLQCPYCIREYPKLQQVLKDYPKDVKLVFKHFPLSFHKKAKPIHAAIALAGKVSDEMFWKMHDLIVANPKKLEIANLRGHAESLGMNMTEFDAVMSDPAKIDALVTADMGLAKKCGVRGTPSIFINGMKLADRKLQGYKTRIDEILAGKDKKAQAGKRAPNIRLKSSDGEVIQLKGRPADKTIKKVKSSDG